MMFMCYNLDVRIIHFNLLFVQIFPNKESMLCNQDDRPDAFDAGRGLSLGEKPGSVK